MCGGSPRFPVPSTMEFRCKSVRIDIELGIQSQLVILTSIILMAFYPMSPDGSSQFLMQLTNDGKIVVVVWLLGWSIVSASYESDPIDSNATANQPSKPASVSQFPEACEKCDQEKWTSKTTQFAASRASDFNRSINRSRSGKKSLLFGRN